MFGGGYGLASLDTLVNNFTKFPGRENVPRAVIAQETALTRVAASHNPPRVGIYKASAPEVGGEKRNVRPAYLRES